MKESLMFFPRLTNKRYVRQSSVMMLCHRPWENFRSEYPKNVQKIIFPSGARNEVRHLLRVFGITPSFVKPDLDGLSAELNDRWIHRKRFWYPIPPSKAPEECRMLANLRRNRKRWSAKPRGHELFRVNLCNVSGHAKCNGIDMPDEFGTIYCDCSSHRKKREGVFALDQSIKREPIGVHHRIKRRDPESQDAVGWNPLIPANLFIAARSVDKNVAAKASKSPKSL